MTNEANSSKKRTAVRSCPVCGHESWPIAYGMITPDDMAQHPKTEFAGCCIVHEERLNRRTGQLEYGVPEGACQNVACRHRRC